MTTTSHRGKTVHHLITVAAALAVSALALGTTLAQAATADAAAAPAETASHAERAMSDSWITTKVKSEIFANSVSKAFKVGVKTKHGAVTLKGKLPNQDAIDLVKLIAEKVKGVKSVDVSGLVIGA